MSLAKDFAEIASRATPGPWTMRDSLWHGSWTVEGPRGFDQDSSDTGLHAMFDSQDDAAFIAWAGTNREEIERGLRLLEMVEASTTVSVGGFTSSPAVLLARLDAKSEQKEVMK